MRSPEEWLEQVVLPGLVRLHGQHPELHTLRACVELCLTQGTGADRREQSCWFQLGDQAASACPGRAPRPDLILRVQREDLPDLLQGFLRPEAALIDGRMEVAGDAGLMARLAPLGQALLDSLALRPGSG